MKKNTRFVRSIASRLSPFLSFLGSARLDHLRLGLLVVLAIPIGAIAQTPSAEKPHRVKVASVEISGMRDQDWKPYRVLLRGLDAYESHRAMAPDTSFRFVLRPQSEELEVADTHLKLVGENVVLPIPIAEDWSFALPRNQQAAEENAELVLNQRQNRMRWNLLAIRSKGLAEHHRRLGDLRLTCEVFAAMEDWDKLRRQLGLRGVNSGNACVSPRLNWTFYERLPLKSAMLINEKRTENLRLTPDRLGFVVYLFDQSWSDHALIQLEFDEQME
ncbi:hypothetical protein RF679_17110 [Undibacterium cyanobacteriorum]|uniref:Uncharacterized protein n=1 Tax=Undibacterium cyanobacteriorum TaxID=3073561 RepID=A0ABY9RGK0_9BURK|nr:hypothetical protein [Undibacterium sp. 20NA77.5]WMW80346.1 hypothetical protein RF679_17110 [Undibacterium sp. 20NA77.5]